MATLYITEFLGQGRDGTNLVAPTAQLQPIAEQTVTVSGASTQSAALNGATGLIRLISDVVCSVSVSSNPTATVTKMRLAADSPEYFCVIAGQSLKVAVIANT